MATVLVALATWPVYAPRPRTEDEDGDIATTSRRLRAGITLTYVAATVLALAMSSAWWSGPSGQDRSAVEVATLAGQICGSLATPSGPGTVDISAGRRNVELAPL